jgi:DNA-binding response OmpR family regulator
MGKRLLLVEDELTLARSVARLLRRHGFDIYLAADCDEARRAPGTFSLGIFDIDLPDGDGVDLAKELSIHGAVRRVVFFSGTAEASQQAVARKVGPLVEKSRGFPDLLAVIELALATQHAKVAGAENINVGSASSRPPPSGIRGSGNRNRN